MKTYTFSVPMYRRDPYGDLSRVVATIIIQAESREFAEAVLLHHGLMGELTNEQ